MPDIFAMLTHERDKLNRAIEALGGTVDHAVINLTKATDRQGKHKVSAAARPRMAAGQKARWAKLKDPAAAPAKAQTKAPAKVATPFVAPKEEIRYVTGSQSQNQCRCESTLGENQIGKMNSFRNTKGHLERSRWPSCIHVPSCVALGCAKINKNRSI
jgi:hypothetical protein